LRFNTLTVQFSFNWAVATCGVHNASNAAIAPIHGTYGALARRGSRWPCPSVKILNRYLFQLFSDLPSRHLDTGVGRPYAEAMNVKLTPDQEAFIKQAIESGRLNRPEDAVREALLLWEQRERSRTEILAALDEAEADLKAGHYTDYGREALPDLVEELKREARQLRKSESLRRSR